MKKVNLNIAWLYPDLMNTYGDRGNIIVLTKRCELRNISCNIKELNVGFDEKELLTSDLIFMGGAQDRQQKIVSEDLFKKAKTLKRVIQQGKVGLFICGAYQFLGKYYKEADQSIIDGLGILDLYTENPGFKSKRLIGNIAVKNSDDILIGFENHGGRTYLGKDLSPFGKVLSGLGNNGTDKTEGAKYKNIFGTYMHGPLLPKNPNFADFLIKLALENKYEEKISLLKLNDDVANLARKAIASRMSIEV